MQKHHSDIPSYVSSLTLGIIDIDDTARTILIVNVGRGIAAAFDKTYKHLGEDAKGLDTKWRAVKVRAELEIYQRRAAWNIGQVGTLPSPTSDGIAAWEKRVIGTVSTAEFFGAYCTFWKRKGNGTLPAPVPPPPSSPSTSADATALLAFWRAVAADDSMAAVGDAALRALSIPISQTVVKRSFSMLSNREIDSRLHAGNRYVISILMLACNRPYYAAEL